VLSALRHLRVEEIRGRVVHLQPGAVTQESVDLIGQHELAVLDAVIAQRFDEADRLGEGDVVII